MAFYLSRKTGRKKFSLATAKNTSVLLWIAEQKGLLNDQQVQIDFNTVPYSLKGLELLLENKTECACLVEANVAYLGFFGSKEPVKCFASVQKRYDDQIIVRGIESASPADLKSKKFGFMPRTTSHPFMLRFFERHGLSKKDVTLKVLTPQAMPDALIRGDVDAISVWNPHALYTIQGLKELGIPFTIFENTGFYASEVVLAAKKSFLIKNEKIIRATLDAMKNAHRYAQENPQDSMQIVAQKMNVPFDVLKNYWHQFVPQVSPVDSDFMNKITQLGEWIRESDTEFKGQPLPDYADLIDNRLFS